jgi:hypothetical protein
MELMKTQLGSLQDELGSLQVVLGSLQDELGSLQDELGSLQDEQEVRKEATEKWQAASYVIQGMFISLSTAGNPTDCHQLSGKWHGVSYLPRGRLTLPTRQA